MGMLTFSRRTAREILRDPLTILFGLGFPLVLLGLMTAIQQNMPVPLFQPARLTPGIAVFGQAFLALFSATLVARDRTGSFLRRLYTTPLTGADFILGYTLPLVPIGLAQSGACYLAAVCMGLAPTAGILRAMAAGLPTELFFIGLGLLCGTVLTDRQVGGLCGALLTNLTAWLSGAWFDVDMVGGWFRSLAQALPFLHGVQAQRAALAGAPVWTDLAWVTGYAALALLAAAAAFTARMRKG